MPISSTLYSFFVLTNFTVSPFLIVPLKILKITSTPLNELKTEDVYIDTDSDRIIEECKTLSNIICYKRDIKHIKLENNIEFGVSPVLLMIENFLDKYVYDDNEIIITPHVTSPYIKLKTMVLDQQSLQI